MRVLPILDSNNSHQNSQMFSSRIISSQKRMDDFTHGVLNSVKKNRVINQDTFAEELRTIGESFRGQNQENLMNKGAKRLAETLVSLKQGQLAGMVYSFLIKYNKGNTKVIEEFATNALAIAKRVDDPIHVMARANDLKEIYKIRAPRSEKHIKVLYEEKRALVRIINDYDALNKRVSRRDMKPKEGYTEKLAAVKMEIGQVLFEKDNKLARKELQEALEMYKILGEGKNSEKIQKLLSK